MAQKQWLRKQPLPFIERVNPALFGVGVGLVIVTLYNIWRHYAR